MSSASSEYLRSRESRDSKGAIPATTELQSGPSKPFELSAWTNSYGTQKINHNNKVHTLQSSALVAKVVRVFVHTAYL